MPTARACVGCAAAQLLPQGRSMIIPFPAFDGLAMAIAIAAAIRMRWACWKGVTVYILDNGAVDGVWSRANERLKVLSSHRDGRGSCDCRRLRRVSALAHRDGLLAEL